MKGVHLVLVSRHLPDVIALGLVLLAQAMLVWWILRGPAARAPQWVRRAIWAFAACSFAALSLGFLLRFGRVSQYFSPWWPYWGRGLAIAWALLSLVWILSFAVSSVLPGPGHSAPRRNFLRAANVLLFAAPAAAIGYGVFIERVQLRLREETIPIPGLHPDLDGIRLVQLTDIHMSPFLTERELARAIAMANETRAHIALVTGDLITFANDPLDTCMARLAGLRADAGIFGCLGNHEIYANVEDYVTEHGARLGIRFLRSQAVPLKFGNAVLNLAGVDYQRFHEPYLVGAGKLVQPGVLNVLLSHNPDVFPVAARQGYQMTIAGHTHGGQVRVEILRQDLNIARIFTRYVDGLYREGGSSIFVSRGIGTIGLPARLGSTPEVALLRLCRT